MSEFKHFEAEQCGILSLCLPHIRLVGDHLEFTDHSRFGRVHRGHVSIEGRLVVYQRVSDESKISIAEDEGSSDLPDMTMAQSIGFTFVDEYASMPLYLLSVVADGLGTFVLFLPKNQSTGRCFRLNLETIAESCLPRGESQTCKS